MSEKWTMGKIIALCEMVAKQMKENGVVDFEIISQRVRRSANSCRAKAYALGLTFKTTLREIPDTTPRKRYDMVNLPLHKNGRKVNYT